MNRMRWFVAGWVLVLWSGSVGAGEVFSVAGRNLRFVAVGDGVAVARAYNGAGTDLYVLRPGQAPVFAFTVALADPVIALSRGADAILAAEDLGTVRQIVVHAVAGSAVGVGVNPDPSSSWDRSEPAVSGSQRRGLVIWKASAQSYQDWALRGRFFHLPSLEGESGVLPVEAGNVSLPFVVPRDDGGVWATYGLYRQDLGMDLVARSLTPSAVGARFEIAGGAGQQEPRAAAGTGNDLIVVFRDGDRFPARLRVARVGSVSWIRDVTEESFATVRVATAGSFAYLTWDGTGGALGGTHVFQQAFALADGTPTTSAPQRVDAAQTATSPEIGVQAGQVYIGYVADTPIGRRVELAQVHASDAPAIRGTDAGADGPIGIAFWGGGPEIVFSCVRAADGLTVVHRLVWNDLSSSEAAPVPVAPQTPIPPPPAPIPGSPGRQLVTGPPSPTPRRTSRIVLSGGPIGYVSPPAIFERIAGAYQVVTVPGSFEGDLVLDGVQARIVRRGEEREITSSWEIRAAEFLKVVNPDKLLNLVVEIPTRLPSHFGWESVWREDESGERVPVENRLQFIWAPDVQVEAVLRTGGRVLRRVSVGGALETGLVVERVRAASGSDSQWVGRVRALGIWGGLPPLGIAGKVKLMTLSRLESPNAEARVEFTVETDFRIDAVLASVSLPFAIARGQFDLRNGKVVRALLGGKDRAGVPIWVELRPETPLAFDPETLKTARDLEDTLALLGTGTRTEAYSQGRWERVSAQADFGYWQGELELEESIRGLDDVYWINGQGGVQVLAQAAKPAIDFFRRPSERTSEESKRQLERAVKAAPALGPLENVVVFPNPCRTGDTVTFSNVPAGSRVEIFTLLGEALSASDDNTWDLSRATLGDIRWTVRDHTGTELVTGGYVFKVSGPAGARVAMLGVKR